MKSIPVSILAILFFNSGFCQTETQSNAPSSYDIKSGKIVYKFTNGIQQGTKTLVFDNYGRDEKLITHTIMSSDIGSAERNAGDTTHEMILKKEGFLYKINLTDGTGFKLTRGETLPLNLNALRPGQAITGNDTVLGRECVIVEAFGSLKTWYWNRIPIKKQVAGRGMTITVEENAVKIDENYSPDKSEFEIPEGIKIK